MRPGRQAQNCGLMSNSTGNAERARLRGEHQIEIREIDAHEHVGALAAAAGAADAGRGGSRAASRPSTAVKPTIASSCASPQVRSPARCSCSPPMPKACVRGLELPELLEDARAIDVRARLADDHHQLRAASGGKRGTRLACRDGSRARGTARSTRSTANATPAPSDRADRHVERKVRAAGDAREADEARRQQEEIAAPRAEAVDQRGGGRERRRRVSRRKRFLREARADLLEAGASALQRGIADRVLGDRAARPAASRTLVGRGDAANSGSRSGRGRPTQSLTPAFAQAAKPSANAISSRFFGKRRRSKRAQAEPRAAAATTMPSPSHVP